MASPPLDPAAAKKLLADAAREWLVEHGSPPPWVAAAAWFPAWLLEYWNAEGWPKLPPYTVPARPGA